MTTPADTSRPSVAVLAAMATLGLLVAVTAGACRRQPSSARPNIILVLVDTLRADHLGSYGYERETSPALDELARTGLRFESVISYRS